MKTEYQSFKEIQAKLIANQEIALVDLREEDEFARGHPLFAVNISLSKLEIEIFNRIPRLSTSIVLYANDDNTLNQAKQRLEQWGYQNISLLEGGLEGWTQAGGEIFIDVNSASKAFGEFVEHHKNTPSLTAQEVQNLIQQKQNIRILDVRRFDEYQTMSIPTAINVPGAELALHAHELIQDEQTKIIINCAGRTRSLIGAQSLINIETQNPVYALRNGTIGWTLAGQQLAIHQDQQYSDFEGQSKAKQFLSRAKQLAEQAGVKTISFEQLKQWQAEQNRTTYVFDVRSEQEYQLGHLAHSRWIAGGQLVQETDHYASVRGARVVLIDDQYVRAYMSASWLAQMNWEVAVLETDFKAVLNQQGAWQPEVPDIQIQHRITAPELKAWLDKQQSITILDFTTSANYQKGHIPSAKWLLKAQIQHLIDQEEISTQDKIVVTCGTSLLAQYAIPELEARTSKPVYLLEGGNRAWSHYYALETSKHTYLSPKIDRYKRPYEGTDNSHQAMQAYLDWEFGLVAQLEKDASHGFFVV